MARKFLIAVAVLLGLLCIASLVVSLQPDKFSVTRTMNIAAPASDLFPLINDLRAWDRWSPWNELDPDAKSTYSTPSAGIGATCAWSGNEKVGEGRMTILASKPDELVEVEQEFIRPFPAKASMVFTLAATSGGTAVTWRMDGANNFIGKAMCMVADMDSLLGKDFERALVNIKAIAEGRDPAPAGGTP